MTEFWSAWAVFLTIQILATMSPGPAFVVAVRNALSYERKSAVITALGLSLGVSVHVVFVLLGLSFIIQQSAVLFAILKYSGAAYLFYLGIKGIMARKNKSLLSSKAISKLDGARTLTVRNALWQGFLTNLLNPKAVVFFSAIFTQFITPQMPFSMHAIYAVTPISVEFLWFAGVAFFLTQSNIQKIFTRFIHWVERLCGGLMILLGIRLLLSKQG